MVDELGGERSMRRRARVGGSVELDMSAGVDGDSGEEMEEGEGEGEGSTMDIEDD